MKNETNILIVDVQAAFAIPPALVAQIERYSFGFSRRVFTKFVNLPDSFFRTELGRDSCVPRSPDTRLLIPPGKNDLVMSKHGYGFSAAQIQRLRKHRITEVEVCGVDTDACVLGVMFTLFDARIRAKVIPRLCWSSQGLHSQAVDIMRSQF